MYRERPRGTSSIHLFELLRKIGTEVQCERRFEWLTVPIEEQSSVFESEFRDTLRAHCEATRHRHTRKAECDPAALFADHRNVRRARILEFDFYFPDQNIAIEFDERQHFTEERKVTLSCSFYDNARTSFFPLSHVQRWRDLCSPKIQDADPPCRDWRRAYRDGIRDVRAAKHGVKLLRLYYKDYRDEACAGPDAKKNLLHLICNNS